MKSLVALTALALVGACSEDFSVHFSTSSISIHEVHGATAPTEVAVISAEGDGTPPTVLYVAADVTGVGVMAPLVTINAVSQTATITVLPDTSLPAGIYTGSLTLFACKDNACEHNFPGSPHAVVYRVELGEALSTASPQVTVTATETTVGTPTALGISLPATATVSYIDGTSWLSVASDAGHVILRPDATTLRAGTYQATLTLHSDDPSQTVTVPVTFIVTPALTPVGDVTFTLTGSSVPADSQGELAVLAATGVLVPAWSAVSDVPWLLVDPPAGAVGDAVNWHLDLAAVSKLDNFAEHIGHIIVTAGPAVTPMRTEVVITKQLPEITDLDRLALVPGRPGTLMVYGEGFDTIAAPSTDLRIAGVASTAVTVLSAHTLSVDVPAISTGEYAVTLTNALGISTRSKPLSVLAPVVRAHQEIASDGDKLSMAWDAVTQSAYVINRSVDLVMRFDLSKSPAEIKATTITGVRALGIPIDRSVLVIDDVSGSLHDLDPIDLTVVRSRKAGVLLEASDTPIPMTGGALAWIGSYNGLAYDLTRSSPATSVESAGRFLCRTCAASPNGRRVVTYQGGTTSPPLPLGWWDASDGTMHAYTNDSFGSFNGITSDHAGDRWILDLGGLGGISDFSLTSQGTIATPSGWTAIRYAMSRNGKRAYIYAIAEGAIGTYSEPNPIRVFPKIFVFDTTGPLITTTTFPLLGSFDVAAYGSCLATQGPAVCSPYSLAFAITDDDQTLLAIGDRRLLVIPVPMQYQ